MNKIAVICNTMNEYYSARMGLGVTLRNAGEDFDLFVWDNGSKDERIKELVRGFKPKFYHESEENVGNPIAYNQMLLRVKEQGYDYVAMIAPDMVLPNRWLSLYKEVYERCDLEGLLGYNWGMHQKKKMEIVKGVPLEFSDYVFGCWFFSTKFLDIVGFINEKYKVYGKWDSDWNFRGGAMGIKSYYLPVRCNHLTKAVGEDKEYRRMKDKHLAMNEETFKSEIMRYAQTGDYHIPQPNKIEL